MGVMESGPAVFSDDRNYRYVLSRHWSQNPGQQRHAMWIGLNPSTADEHRLDPTLRRVLGFTKDWGYDGFWMTNLFGFRATIPRVMLLQDDPVGPQNDEWLRTIAVRSEVIVCAWGAHGSHRDRSQYVVNMLREAGQGDKLKCLGITQKGQPKHPLYLAADTALIPCP